MQRLDGRTREQYGHHVWVSHGQSHGLAVGELTVLDNLPEPLAQGLFAHAATYPVIVRRLPKMSYLIRNEECAQC